MAVIIFGGGIPISVFSIKVAKNDDIRINRIKFVKIVFDLIRILIRGDISRNDSIRWVIWKSDINGRGVDSIKGGEIN